jgi:hypothetical protein
MIAALALALASVAIIAIVVIVLVTLRKGSKIMADFSKLTQAVTDLKTQVANAAAQGPSADQPNIDAATASIQQASATLAAAFPTAQPTSPPPPPPPPAPAPTG